MSKAIVQLGNWPSLEWNEWQDTADTLHMFMQIVGKTKLSFTPLQNHWWNTTLFLTARGLSTLAIPAADGIVVDIEFDFIAHEVICRSSGGEVAKVELRPMSVAQFYEEFVQALGAMGVAVRIDRMPVEVPNPIRCDIDTTHSAYDHESVYDFWQVLRIADTLLKRFSTNFYGKISPVHFFWGSLDLAVTRFSGRRAPARFSDVIQAEAYSHEVISAGFWPGNGGYGQAAFYCYAAPVPPGLDKAIIQGIGAFNPTLGEYVLNYEDARLALNPENVVLQFLEETYNAAADCAQWDRPNLDRDDAVARL